MLRQALEPPATVPIIGETLVDTEASIEATAAVAEAEVGGMTVEIGVAKLKEITEIDEMIEAHLRRFATIEDGIDGDENHTEVGDHHHPKDEVVHRITPHEMFAIHLQTSI